MAKSSSQFAGYESQIIEDFSAGVNTLFNPRVLQPAPQTNQPAESPFMQNIDIVSKGALITSPGYTLVASLAATGQGATATASLTGTGVNTITIVNGGSGYTSVPTVTIQGVLNVGSGATAHAVLTGGVVTSIVVDAAGTGYLSPPSVTITSQSGVLTLVDYEKDPGALILNNIATATATLTTGAVSSFTVTNGGQGYIAPPEVVISGGGGTGATGTAVLTGGVVTSISVGSGGSGYTSPPTVTLKPADWQLAVIDNALYKLDAGGTTLDFVGILGERAQFWNIVIFKGTSGLPTAIIGNSSPNNPMMQWDGVNLSAVSGAPMGGYIMEVYAGSLIVAIGNTIYGSDTYDQTNWSTGNAFSKAFNQNITGLFVLDNTSVVYTKRNAYQLQATFQSDALGNQKLIWNATPYRKQSGNVAPKAVNNIYNDIYAFSSSDGVQRFGSDPQFISTNLRVNSLSWKINPSLLPQNYNTKYIAQAASGYFNKKFYFSLPYGTNTFNSQTFVYNYDYDAWSSRSGILASQYSVAPDNYNQDALYFGNPFAAEIYKFYNNYDYNLSGYDREYTSKIFTMGNGMRTKFWQWIDIKGAMYINTKFFVDLIVDGMTATYYIDKDSIDPAISDGYYGDNYYGGNYYGGTQLPSQFLRYGSRIPFPVNIKSGRECQIVFRNFEAGQPWTVDYLNIVYNWEDQSKVPYNYQNAVLTQ